MNDPELASEMMALLGKELKAARQRIRELENERQLDSQDAPATNSDTLRERAEAAEHAMEVLQRNVEEVNEKNANLRHELDELRPGDSKKRIKKEHDDQTTSTQSESTIAEVHSMLADGGEDEREFLATGNDVQDLEAALEKYYAKYRAAKEAKNQWRESCQSLESENDLLRSAEHDLREENTRLSEEVQGLTGDLQSTNKEIKDLKTKQRVSVVERDKFEAYMARFPKSKARQAAVSLREICYKGVDLKAYLSTDPRLTECAKNFLYLPDRLSWCQADQHHAFALAPMLTFDQSKKAWSKGKAFDGLDKKVFSLFYSSKNAIYYAGIYKAHRLRSLNREGVAMWKGSGVFSNALVEAMISGETGNDDAQAQLTSKVALAALYLQDVFKVEVLGLQCVGFDKKTYDLLRERFENSQRTTAGFYPDDVQPPRKKQKKTH